MGLGGQRLAALSFHRRVDVKLPGIYSTCPVKETFNKHSVRVESVAFSRELGTGDGLVSVNRVNILSVNGGRGGTTTPRVSILSRHAASFIAKPLETLPSQILSLPV